MNNAHQLAPWADVLYFADFQWWGWNKDRADYQAFAGQKVSIQPSNDHIDEPGVHFLHNGHMHGLGRDVALSEEADVLVPGGTGGYQSMGLAYLAGAAEIILMGFDMTPGNWHRQHKAKAPDSNYSVFIDHMNKIAPALAARGVRVLNATRRTALTCFERVERESVLPDQA